MARLYGDELVGSGLLDHAGGAPGAGRKSRRRNARRSAARFYAETDEARALALLAAERSRCVLSDWELPFRRLADGTHHGPLSERR